MGRQEGAAICHCEGNAHLEEIPGANVYPTHDCITAQEEEEEIDGAPQRCSELGKGYKKGRNRSDAAHRPRTAQVVHPGLPPPEAVQPHGPNSRCVVSVKPVPINGLHFPGNNLANV